MTLTEIDYNIRVPALLNEISKQLKIANQLKALELKRSFATPESNDFHDSELLRKIMEPT